MGPWKKNIFQWSDLMVCGVNRPSMSLNVGGERREVENMMISCKAAGVFLNDFCWHTHHDYSSHSPPHYLTLPPGRQAGGGKQTQYILKHRKLVTPQALQARPGQHLNPPTQSTHCQTWTKETRESACRLPYVNEG